MMRHQGQLPDLGMQRLDVRQMLPLVRSGGKYLDGPLQQLGFPLRDLVRVHIAALGQLCQRLITLDDSYRHLCFEYGCVVTTGSSHALCPSGV